MATSTQITRKISYSCDSIYAALSTREYWDYELKNIEHASGNDNPDAGSAGEVRSFDSSAEQVQVELSNPVPASLIPDNFRMFLPQNLSISRSMSFTQEGDSISGSLKAEIPGQPVSVTGSIRISPEEDSSQSSFHSSVEISVSIPIMGSRIESMLSSSLGDIIGQEAEILSSWMSQQ